MWWWLVKESRVRGSKKIPWCRGCCIIITKVRISGNTRLSVAIRVAGGFGVFTIAQHSFILGLRKLINGSALFKFGFIATGETVYGRHEMRGEKVERKGTETHKMGFIRVQKLVTAEKTADTGSCD